MPQDLPDNTLVSWRVPPNTRADTHSPGAQALRIVFKLLMSLFNELVDVLVGTARRKSPGTSDVRIECAVEELELRIQR